MLNVKEIENDYKILDKYIHDIWKDNDFSSGRRSGFGNVIYKKIKPSSIDDFFERQQEYANLNKKEPIYYRGLTLSELEELASKLKLFSEYKKPFLKLKFSEKEYINYILYVNYIQTFNGKKGEENIIKFLKNKNIPAELADDELDSKYGIDILFDNDKGIQLKSSRFLISNKKSVITDIHDLKKKYHKSLKEKGIKTFYIFYDKQTNSYLTFENDKILTEYNVISKILDMNIIERKKYIKNIKKKSI